MEEPLTQTHAINIGAGQTPAPIFISAKGLSAHGQVLSRLVQRATTNAVISCIEKILGRFIITAIKRGLEHGNDISG